MFDAAPVETAPPPTYSGAPWPPRARPTAARRARAPARSTSRTPVIDDLLVIERGEGPYVFDTRGKRYIDALSCLFCAQIGYSYGEEMAAAAGRQLTTLAFNTNWASAHPPAIELAEKLASLAPGDLNRVLFTSGGSESVEAAWKLCREYHLATASRSARRRSRATSPTTASRSARCRSPASSASRRRSARPRSTSPTSPTPTPSAPPTATTREAFCARLLAEVEEAIVAADPDEVALIIAEPIQNAGGCLVAAARLLEGPARARRQVRRAADGRRGDLRLRAPRRVVRDRPRGRRARISCRWPRG